LGHLATLSFYSLFLSAVLADHGAWIEDSGEGPSRQLKGNFRKQSTHGREAATDSQHDNYSQLSVGGYEHKKICSDVMLYAEDMKLMKGS
jgi:hypothetical protein